MITTLTELHEGMTLICNGNESVTIPHDIASEFKPGDHIVVVDGRALIIPKTAIDTVHTAVEHAMRGFYALAAIDDDTIHAFYDEFMTRLQDDACWGIIHRENNHDIQRAQSKGASTTRLVADDRCRTNMIHGLTAIQGQSLKRNDGVHRVDHGEWSVDIIHSPLGVVGFVFEGRPNVIADATALLKSGNTVVFRVGQDALNTARAMMTHALYPALDAVGIPRSVIQLIDDPRHASAWALFANQTVQLAVARGSGHAVRTLGRIAQQYGTPVSLHGTGGAWMMATDDTSADRLSHAIIDSLDRKVCNTLNTLCVPRSRLHDLIPVILSALSSAGHRLNAPYKVHVDAESMTAVDWPANLVDIQRAHGMVTEPQFEPLDRCQLGTEWMWETAPEISLVVVDSLDESIALFNQYAPLFVVSVISHNQADHDRVFQCANAPFVGNGMTRWVDGQYALHSPELGVSNWENGRLLSRSAILTGNGVFTSRIRMTQTSAQVGRS